MKGKRGLLTDWRERERKKNGRHEEGVREKRKISEYNCQHTNTHTHTEE